MYRGLVWHLMTLYLRSYKYFPPLLVFLVGLMLLYANRPNPVMESYAASSVLIYFVSAWIGSGFAAAIGDAHEHVAVVHAGSARKYLAGKALAVIACGWLLGIAALLWPVASGSFGEPVRAGDWLTALAAHWELSALGGLTALLAGRPIIRSGSMAAASLLLVLILSVVRNGVLGKIGDGFAPLFVLLPPAAPLVDWLMDPGAAAGIESAAVWGWPLLYGGALFGLFLRLAEKRM